MEQLKDYLTKKGWKKDSKNFSTRLETLVKGIRMTAGSAKDYLKENPENLYGASMITIAVGQGLLGYAHSNLYMYITAASTATFGIGSTLFLKGSKYRRKKLTE